MKLTMLTGGSSSKRISERTVACLAIFASALLAGWAQPTVNLPGRTIVKMLPDYRRPLVYALDSGPAPAGNGSLLALNSTNAAIAGEIALGRTPTDMDIDPSWEALYVILWDDTIWKIDLSAFTTAQVRSIPPPGNHFDGAHYHIQATASNLVYYVDARWAPMVHRFDFSTGTELARFELGEGFGAGDIVLSRMGDVLYGWTQFGWNIGYATSWVAKVELPINGFPVAGTSFRSLRRDPLDTPIFLDGSEQRVFNKKQVFAATNLALLAEFSENLYGLSYHGELAVGEQSVFDGFTGAALTNLPFSTRVMAFSGDQQRLFLYHAGSQQVVVWPVDAFGPFSRAPVNDAFVHAVEIPSLSHQLARGQSTTSFATHEPGEPSHYSGSGAGSVWFTWVAPWSADVVLSTTGSPSGSFLAAYHGTALTNLTPIAAGYSAVAQVTQNERYFIAADAPSGMDGPVQVSVFPPPPSNDAFSNALEIPSLDLGIVNAEGTTAFATYEAGEPPPWIEGGTGSVWFTWVAPWSRDILLSTVGSQSGSFIALYAGTALTNLVPLAGGTSFVARVSQGQRYFIVADALAGNEGPLRWSLYGPPVNDDFANALQISGAEGAFQGTNISASAQPGEPAGWIEDSSASIWWRWTAPASGDFWFKIASSIGVTVVSSVYIGDEVTHLTTVSGPLLASSPAGQQGTVFRARMGQTYSLRFSGVESSSGDGRWGTFGVLFRFTALPNLPVNDFFVDRLPLTGLTNVVSADNTLASFEPEESDWTTCDQALRTLWWSYTAPTNGELHLTAGGLLRTTCAFYRGESLTSLEWVTASCYYPLGVRLQTGETLQIRLDSGSGLAGPMILETVFHPIPANDAFADSVRLEGTNITATGDNLAATLEPGEPAVGPGCTVWYSWVAPLTGRTRFIPGSVNLIRSLGIYTGAAVDSLQAVRVVGDGGGGILAFLAIEGTVYHFQVGEVASGIAGAGPFAFTIQATALQPATNDDFADAVWLKDGVFAGGGSVEGATLESGEPAHWGSVNCKSLWWQWQPPRNGPISIYAGGSLVPDVVLAIYTGDSVEALTLVAKGTNVVRAGLVQGGVTYHIAAVVAEEAVGDVAFYSSAMVATPPAIPVPGNLLLDPSFEGTSLLLTNWQATLPFGGSVNERGGADGTTWISLAPGGRLWQDFPTVPDRIYQVRLACVGAPLRVLWDDRELGMVETPADEGYWHWPTFTNTATAGTSRLTLTNIVPWSYWEIVTNTYGLTNAVGHTNYGPYVALDALSVISLNEPPSIETPPASASVPLGGAVAFAVGARGSPPLAHQWFFNGTVLPGQTARLLTLESVTLSDAGQYHTVVTNAFGAVTSPPATLVVEAPATPMIVLQPYGDTVAVGGYFAFQVAAIGLPPLRYQWFHDGQEVSGATSDRLVFGAVGLPDGGTYTVRVSNEAEAVWSLPARLEVSGTSTGGGTVDFRNRLPFGGDAPVFDVDGVTPLAGPGFVAQFYGGLSLEMLRPAGTPSPFLTGSSAGFFLGKVVTNANVPPLATAWAQVRAWEASKGASYEAARALGGKFGKSEVLQVTTGGVIPPSPPVPPGRMTGLRSFSLQAGLPRFTVGLIELAERRADGLIVWSLRGEAGARYAIETATAGFVWRPLMVITNSSGTTTFIDPTLPLAGGAFYRARILD